MFSMNRVSKTFAALALALPSLWPLAAAADSVYDNRARTSGSTVQGAPAEQRYYDRRDVIPGYRPGARPGYRPGADPGYRPGAYDTQGTQGTGRSGACPPGQRDCVHVNR